MIYFHGLKRPHCVFRLACVILVFKMVYCHLLPGTVTSSRALFVLMFEDVVGYQAYPKETAKLGRFQTAGSLVYFGKCFWLKSEFPSIKSGTWADVRGSAVVPDFPHQSTDNT